MDPGKIFQIITNSTLLATRLLSEPGQGLVEFHQSRYCTILTEDTPISNDVITVSAMHTKSGHSVRYSITEGDPDGIFKIDETSGTISLAASLDFEQKAKHVLVISGESGGAVSSTTVQILVQDVNDSPPIFLKPNPIVTVIEEDDRHLPAVIAKVSAMDLDVEDKNALIYTVEGDGIDGLAEDEAFFTINSGTGELIQLKALDRDPPHGKGAWKLLVEVMDGQHNTYHPTEYTSLDDNLQGDQRRHNNNWDKYGTGESFDHAKGSWREEPHIRYEKRNYLNSLQSRIRRSSRGLQSVFNKIEHYDVDGGHDWKRTVATKDLTLSSSWKEDMRREKRDDNGMSGDNSTFAVTNGMRLDRAHEDSFSDYMDILSSNSRNGNISKEERPINLNNDHIVVNFSKENKRWRIIRPEIKIQANAKEDYPLSFAYIDDENKNQVRDTLSTNSVRMDMYGVADGKSIIDTNIENTNPYYVGREDKRAHSLITKDNSNQNIDTSDQNAIYSINGFNRNTEDSDSGYSENDKLKDFHRGRLSSNISNAKRKKYKRLSALERRKHEMSFNGKEFLYGKYSKQKEFRIPRQRINNNVSHLLPEKISEGEIKERVFHPNGRSKSLDNLNHYSFEILSKPSNEKQDMDEKEDIIESTYGSKLQYDGNNSNDRSRNIWSDEEVDNSREKLMGRINYFNHKENLEVSSPWKRKKVIQRKRWRDVSHDNDSSYHGGKNMYNKMTLENPKPKRRRSINLEDEGRGKDGWYEVTDVRDKRKDVFPKKGERFHEIPYTWRVHDKKCGESTKRMNKWNGHKGMAEWRQLENGDSQLMKRGRKVRRRRRRSDQRSRSNFRATQDHVKIPKLEPGDSSFTHILPIVLNHEKIHGIRHIELKRINKRRVMKKKESSDNKKTNMNTGEIELLNDYGYKEIYDPSSNVMGKEHGGILKEIRKSNSHIVHAEKNAMDEKLDIEEKSNEKNILTHLTKHSKSETRTNADSDKLSVIIDSISDESVNQRKRGMGKKMTESAKRENTQKDPYKSHNGELRSRSLEDVQSSIATESITAQIPGPPESIEAQIPFRTTQPKLDYHQNLRRDSLVTLPNSRLKLDNPTRNGINLANAVLHIHSDVDRKSDESEFSTSDKQKNKEKSRYMKTVMPRKYKVSQDILKDTGHKDKRIQDISKLKKGTTSENNDQSILRSLARRGIQNNNCNNMAMTEIEWRNVNRNFHPENILRRVHTATTLVTVIVKDINDNAPIFPESKMTGEIKENGLTDVSVAHISAWDADDSSEGLNARIAYSIEKNVIDEDSGRAIFEVNEDTGIIKTSLCCLDRELTPEYQLQVVATDGGGLKGTGTVVIRILDENDNPPQLPNKRFELEMDESWNNVDPEPSTPLLEVTSLDPDIKNEFMYRIVPNSGFGWDLFDLRTEGTTGQLFATQHLDYEDKSTRRDINFRIQVKDQVEAQWTDPGHVDSAWIRIILRDLNDNAPSFAVSHVQKTISEDDPEGMIVAEFSAFDPDTGKNGDIEYKILDDFEGLNISQEGAVKIKKSPIDREALEDAEQLIRIIAFDHGQPSLTSTATLTLIIKDINDCPPYLLPPTTFHIEENSPSTRIGVLKAFDDDLWTLGHGPPFNISLAPNNAAYIKKLLGLRFNKSLDMGRGAALLWTLGEIDREEHQRLSVQVVLTDAKGLQNTETVTVIIDDLNDNYMKPAEKTVYLFKIQGGGSLEIPLGRVYVDDPDDWDIKDKDFGWANSGQESGHPLFTLDQKEGIVYASNQVREGSYHLQFVVSDRTWGQTDVPANVTVIVKTLEYKALLHATHLTLYSTTPDKVTKGWNPMKGGGILGKLMDGITRIVGNEDEIAEIVSVYGKNSNQMDQSHASENSAQPSSQKGNKQITFRSNPKLYKNSKIAASHVNREDEGHQSVSSVSVWITVRNKLRRIYMDPVKVKGLISLHRTQLKALTGLNVGIDDVINSTPSRRKSNKEVLEPLLGREYTHHAEINNDISSNGRDDSKEGHGIDMEKAEEEKGNMNFYTTRYKMDHQGGPSPLASLSSNIVHLQVIDTNATSLVTPRLQHFYDCHKSSMRANQYGQTCTYGSCLNGGKCIQSSTGSRCICPGDSWGNQCKILTRTFKGSGWTWLPSIPPCLPSTIFLRVHTYQNDAILLYSGPIGPRTHEDVVNGNPKSPLLVIQLLEGQPQLIFEGDAGSVKLIVNSSVSDGKWHTIHTRLDHKGVSLLVDGCGNGWKGQKNDSHCASRSAWSKSIHLDSWATSGPLQVGGIAHDPSHHSSHRWAETPITKSLDGCLSDISINGRFMDLGEPPLSQDSERGCQFQEETCSTIVDGGCRIQEECKSGNLHKTCECMSSSLRDRCHSSTVPATLGPSSYYKVALSFNPLPQSLSFQIRIKGHGYPDGVLVRLADHHSQHALILKLKKGKACLEESISDNILQIVCIEGFHVADNEWHLVQAERLGHNLKIIIDEGDDILQNESYPSLITQDLEGWISRTPVPLEVNRHDGVSVGGVPEYAATKLHTVRHDLQKVCIDDLRISGHQMPIPPRVNNTKWGQVTTQVGLLEGCALPDICKNVSCKSPFICHPTWPEPTCSCGPGLQSVGKTCRDINECLWGPCLNGGSCHNLQPGYVCKCNDLSFGDNCQFRKWDQGHRVISGQTIIATVAISILVLVLFGLILSIRHHCMKHQRNMSSENKEQIQNDATTTTGTPVMVINCDKQSGRPDTTTKRLTEEAEVVVMKDYPTYDPHVEFMERLRTPQQTNLIENQDVAVISSVSRSFSPKNKSLRDSTAEGQGIQHRPYLSHSKEKSPEERSMHISTLSTIHTDPG